MKLRRRTRGGVDGRAFTVLELMVIILILVISLGLLLPPLNHPKGPMQRIQCVNNLRQGGIAFRIWSSDNGDKFPMQVSTNLGGAKEFVGEGEVFRVFQVMSNELSNLKFTVCPADERIYPTNWTSDFDNSRVSYFVGLDANASLTNSFLSGDRNLQNGRVAQNGIVELMTGQSISWGTNMHKEDGNMLFADGRVEKLSSAKVRKALAKTGMATNRLVFP
jgi:prepilin-type processing-associated H-X9-DG protein